MISQPLAHQTQQLLQQLPKTTWNHQIQLLSKIPITTQTARLISHMGYSANIATIFTLANPRPQLVLAICQFVGNLFQNKGQYLVPLANAIVTQDCLLRWLAHSNKIIASSANQLLKKMILGTPLGPKRRQIRFVAQLLMVFLHSKVTYCRQKISMYFQFIVTSGYYHSIADLEDFQQKVVRKGLEDASHIVRSHMKQTLQNIHLFGQENLVVKEMETLKKRSKINSQKMIPLSKRSESNNQSVMVVNQGDCGQLKPQKEYKHKQSKSKNKNEQLIQQNQLFSGINNVQHIKNDTAQYKFHLDRIKNRSKWAQFTLSFEYITSIYAQNTIQMSQSTSMLGQTLSVLASLLVQKRNKVDIVAAQTLQLILKNMLNKSKYVVIQCLKNQTKGPVLLQLLLELGGQHAVTYLAQLCSQLKVLKQKTIAVDALIAGIIWLTDTKKIASIVVPMCEIISISSAKHKQLALACLAVLSQLKSRFPQQTLAALMSQNDRMLSQVVELAASIDPSLKQALLCNISTHRQNKTTSSNSLAYHNSKSSSSQLNSINRLDQQIQLIKQGKIQSLRSIGQIILGSTNVSVEEYVNFINISTWLCSKDLLMQFQILLGQLAKSGSQNYLQALLVTLQSPTTITLQSPTTKAKQQQNIDQKHSHLQDCHRNMLLTAVQQYCTCNKKSNDNILLADRLIKMYRKQNSVAIRKQLVSILANMDQSAMESLSQKELELVKGYRLIKSGQHYQNL